MSKNVKGIVKARSVSTMKGCRTKVKFQPENQRIATYPKVKRDNIFDVNENPNPPAMLGRME